MTTGIFIGIAARAAEEERAEGKADITPYWRTIKAGGLLNDKFPGGVAAQAECLEKEGHHILLNRNGKPKQVKNFESKLVKL